MMAGLVIHANYVLSFGTGFGIEFRKLSFFYDIASAMQFFGLFGPSAILLFVSLRMKPAALYRLSALAMGGIAYLTWQPLLLNILSLVDLYPTHLEAFQNFSLRGDWLQNDQGLSRDPS